MRRRSMHSPRRTLMAVLAVFGLTVGLLVGVVAPASAADPASAGSVVDGSASVAVLTESSSVATDVVKAADLSKFDPSNIISDALFYDGAAMSAAEIQAFLDQKIGACQNGKCLNVLNASISSRAARSSTSTGALICSAIQGGTMRVSELIYRLQVACGISAKVILVTLQKEQGLTTSKAPSDWNLNAAMGQACPDTAPCDPAFKGIGPQLVGGVTQLKTYKAAKFGKQPGVNYIQYNPNASCGGTNINIQNWATASLYTYTPYQPNAAALRAGYGLGDGCSSYGNRNFYQYYVDWFGSTQGPATVIVSVGQDIYVVSAGTRYHILPAEWPQYRAAFGSPVAVSASYLETNADGGKASLFVHNNATGTVAYLQDRQTHRFPTCALVASWGGSCSSLTRLSGVDFDRLGAGAQMTSFARLTANGVIHQIAGTALVPFYDTETAAVYNGGTTPYAATLTATAAATYSVGKMRFAPARFMTLAGEGRVWLPTSDGRLIYLPSWSLATEFGVPTTPFKRDVPTKAVAGYTRSGDLSLFVTCGGSTYYAARGVLRPVTPESANGFGVTALDDITCNSLAKVDEPASAVFVAALGQSGIYHAVNGVYRHVSTQQQLSELSGQQSTRVLYVTPATFARFTIGDSYVVAGQLVAATGSPHVYLVDGSRFLHLPSWSLAAAAGLPGSARAVTPSTVANAQIAGALTPFVRCNGVLYIAGGGSYSAVRSGDAAGNAVTDLHASTCETLRLLGPVVAGATYLTDGTVWVVAQGGGFRRLGDTAAAIAFNGGTTPPALTVSASYLGWLPRPTS